MKIISKFHDYYDIGASMGVDETIVYVRNLERIDRPNADLPVDRRGFVGNRRVSLIEHLLGKKIRGRMRDAFGGSFSVVGYCGKLYPVYVCNYRDSSNIHETTKFHYEPSMEMVKDYKKSLGHGIRSSGATETEILRSIQDRMSGFPKESPEIFHELKVPVFIIPDHGSLLHRKLEGSYIYGTDELHDQIYVNPSLKDVDFYKVADSFTAFQEISMFITGVLGVNQIPPVTISDTDMRDAKGFDDMSFKKAPTKRKKK